MDEFPARRMLMAAEYDTREGDVPPEALARRLADLAPVTGAVHALLRLASLPAGARVLDLGTGAGTFALAAARVAPRAEVLGLDLSAGGVAAARRAAEALGLANARFDVADFEHDALPAADAVVCAYALSLASDPAAALANVARSLRPAARLVVFDASWTGNALDLPRLDALARSAGLRAVGRLDLTPDVRALAARGAWPWSNAPAAEAVFAASGFARA